MTAYNASIGYNSPIPYNGESEPVPAGIPRTRLALPVVVVQLDIAGSTEHWFSDIEYGDPDSVTGIGTRWHDARIVGDIAFARTGSCVFWGQRRGRGSGLGNIELINTDGALDSLTEASLADAAVRVYVVDQDRPMATATQIAAARVASIEGRGEQTIRIVTADALAALDRPLQPSLYASGDGVASIIGRPRPIAIGNPLSCPVVLVDDVDYEYDCHDGAGFDIDQVRDSGYPLTPVTQWQISATPGINGVELLQVPVGRIVADISTSGLSSTPVVGADEGDFATDLTDWTITTSGTAAATWVSPGKAELTAESTGSGSAHATMVFPADIDAGQRIEYSLAVEVVDITLGLITDDRTTAVLELLWVPTSGDPVVLKSRSSEGSETWSGTYTPTAEGRIGFRVRTNRAASIEALIDTVRVDLVGPGGTPDAIFEALLARAEIGAERIHAASLAAIAADRPWSMSYFADGAETVDNVMQQALDSIYGWAYEDNAGAIRLGYLQAPEIGDSVLTIDETVLAGEVEVEPDLAPGLSATVAGARNWYQYGAGELADAISDEDRAMLTADYRIRRTATDPVGLELGPRAGARVSDESASGLPTLLDDATDIQAAADYIADLYPETEPRRFYRVPVYLSRTQAATLNPGDKVTLTYPRYGCDAGRPLRVVGVEGRAGDDLVIITGWGSA